MTETEKLRTDIEGSGAEAAIALEMGQQWQTDMEVFQGCDVADEWQVRWSESTRNQNLLIRPRANPNHRYVWVVRWTLAAWGMSSSWFGDNRSGQEAAWWIPPARLTQWDVYQEAVGVIETIENAGGVWTPNGSEWSIRKPSDQIRATREQTPTSVRRAVEDEIEARKAGQR